MKWQKSLYPIAAVASVLNLLAIFPTAGGMHAFAHGAIALGFGLWAQRLRLQKRQPVEAPRALESPDRMQVLESEVSDLQHQLAETQRGLQFAEQLLAKRPEQREQQP